MTQLNTIIAYIIPNSIKLQSSGHNLGALTIAIEEIKQSMAHYI